MYQFVFLAQIQKDGHLYCLPIVSGLLFIPSLRYLCTNMYDIIHQDPPVLHDWAIKGICPAVSVRLGI